MGPGLSCPVRRDVDVVLPRAKMPVQAADRKHFLAGSIACSLRVGYAFILIESY